MDELNVPDFNTERSQPVLNTENLEFHSGDRNFSKEDFIKAVQPYFQDLKRIGRTNYLCLFTYGDGSKPDVTGYRSDTTLNVTNNSRILKSKKTGGTWAVFKLS